MNKESKAKKSKIGNGYLFANLILIVVLLIGIWTNSAVWSAKFDIGSLILLLVIVNTVLLFKDFIIGTYPSKSHESAKHTNTKKSIKPIRDFINSSITIDSKLITDTLNKLKEITQSQYIELSVIEKFQNTPITAVGEQPKQLLGTRLLLNDNKLSIKYSGQLGTEDICTFGEEPKAVRFKSTLTRLHLTLVPLNLCNARLGILAFYTSKAPYSPRVSLASVAVIFESLIAMVEHAQTSTGGYKDKETGLILFKNYEELVDNELERSERYEQEMSLLTIKITDFDKLQDSEKPLICKSIASAMKHSLRRFDLMFYGKDADSYYALLTECGVGEAEGIARRLQKEFNKLIKKVSIAGDTKPVLVIGSATYQTDATHSLGLIEKSSDACANAIESKVDYKAFSGAPESKGKNNRSLK